MKGKLLPILFLVAASSAVAQRKPGLSFEIDPAPFFSGGYSVAAGYEFKRVRLSVNAFSSDLPSFAVEENWSGKIKFGTAVRAQFYFNDERKGFYAGAQVGVLQMRYQYASDPPSDVTQVAFTPTAGYRWFPFQRSGFYIMPAVGVGITLHTTAEVVGGGTTYDQHKAAYIAALHLGFRL